MMGIDVVNGGRAGNRKRTTWGMRGDLLEDLKLLE